MEGLTYESRAIEGLREAEALIRKAIRLLEAGEVRL